MDRGTYVAASGGLLQFKKLELINNNLANINTPGFKKQILLPEREDFDQTLASAIAKNDPYARGDQERMPAAISARSMIDFSPGPIKDTSNPLDVALRNPKDFFVLQTPSGPMYTRAGNFTLNKDGQLVTQDGTVVMGDGGAITANGAGVTIAPDGEVISGKTKVGRLQVVRFEQTKGLERVEGSRFKVGYADGPGPIPVPVEAEVVPHSLEMSNVSAISGVVDLITTSRAFQMYTKSAETIDGMNQQSIGQVGKRS